MVSSTPNKNTTANGGGDKLVNWSDRETKLMAAACQSFRGDPQLDIKRFSQLSGLTEGSARNAWAAIKKKLKASSSSMIEDSNDTNSHDDGPTTPMKRSSSKPSAASARKNNVGRSGGASARNGSANGSTTRTPAKRTAPSTTVIDEDDDDGDEGFLIPVAKRAKKANNTFAQKDEIPATNGDNGGFKVKREPGMDDDGGEPNEDDDDYF